MEKLFHVVFSLVWRPILWKLQQFRSWSEEQSVNIAPSDAGFLYLRFLVSIAVNLKVMTKVLNFKCILTTGTWSEQIEQFTRAIVTWANKEANSLQASVGYHSLVCSFSFFLLLLLLLKICTITYASNLYNYFPALVTATSSKICPIICFWLGKGGKNNE